MVVEMTGDFSFPLMICCCTWPVKLKCIYLLKTLRNKTNKANWCWPYISAAHERIPATWFVWFFLLLLFTIIFLEMKRNKRKNWRGKIYSLICAPGCIISTSLRKDRLIVEEEVNDPKMSSYANLSTYGHLRRTFSRWDHVNFKPFLFWRGCNKRKDVGQQQLQGEIFL